MGAVEPEQVIEHFCRPFNAGDLDGLVNTLYEDDAVFFPSPADAPVSGKAGSQLQGPSSNCSSVRTSSALKISNPVPHCEMTSTLS